MKTSYSAKEGEMFWALGLGYLVTEGVAPTYLYTEAIRKVFLEEFPECPAVISLRKTAQAFYSAKPPWRETSAFDALIDLDVDA